MSLPAELTTGLTAGLETALNTALRLDPDSLPRLQEFAGKIIGIELRGLDLTFYLVPGPDGISVYQQVGGEPDTVLSGTPAGLAQLAFGGDASRVLFAGEVRIRGDVDTGTRFKRFLDELDLDWEEWLSCYTGDVAAHRLGDLFRATVHWGRDALAALGRDAAEYLQQESRAVPTREEVAQFMQAVDVLRDDVARLEARVSRLQRDRGEVRVTRD
jgi:ubiquinone biosynthesis protein UbiJ